MKTFIHTLVMLLCCFPLFAEEQKPESLKIGFIVSLSGPLAEFGEAIRNGVTLAIDENPDHKNFLIPIYEDSKYETKTSITNFQKLRSVDEVDILYVFGGPMSDALSPLAEQAKIPTFSTEYDTRYTRGKKYVVRFANNAADYMNVLLKELRKRKFKNYGVIKVENQYHNTLSDALFQSLGKEESAKLVSNFQPGENNFRPVLPKLNKQSFDALGIYLIPGMQNAFLQQLKSSGKKWQLFGTDSFESREENRNVEDLVEGALFANSAVSNKFRYIYQDRFGNNAQLVHAALAYEFTHLIFDLFAGKPLPENPEKIIEQFVLKESRQSVCGEYFYRNTPETGQYFSFPIAIREVRGGNSHILSIEKAP